VPDIVAEVTAAFERHGTLSSQTTPARSMRAIFPGYDEIRRLRAARSPRPARVLENIRKTSIPGGAENELCRLDPRDDVQFAGSLNLSRKTIIPAVAKGSARAPK
jgi:hypothetical protein